MINENWIRWVRASCKVHFESKKQSEVLYHEATDHDVLKQIQKYGELRVDGPRFIPLNGFTRLEVIINLLITSMRDDNDLYKFDRTAGIFSAAFTESLSVYKFGDGPQDNATSFLGCLTLAPNSPVKFNYFGIIDPTVRLEQGSLEGRYYLDLRSE